MADPIQQDQSSDDKHKKAFIFVGPTTEELKKKITEEARKSGADAVEFVEVPEMASANPKVARALEAVEAICKVYTDWFPGFYDLFIAKVNNFTWKNKSLFEIKTAHHLCDRIIHTPVHVLSLAEQDPFYAYIDCASLNRSLFESVVNCLLLLTQPTNRAFAGLISKSIDEDIKLRTELSKWLSHPDPGISQGAKQQLQMLTTQEQGKRELLRGIGFTGTAPGFPDIKSRCDQLGDVWRFLYVSRYKKLCSWSHVHLEHVFLSPSQGLSSAEDLAHAIGRGTEMVHLGFHLVYLFLLSATEHDHNAQAEINKLCFDVMGKLEPILAKAGSFTAPTGTGEG